jgi:hypothetical protein
VLLERALRGEVIAQLSDLDEPENAYEHERWGRMARGYAPIRANDPSGCIVGAVEFYQARTELNGAVATARADAVPRQRAHAAVRTLEQLHAAAARPRGAVRGRGARGRAALARRARAAAETVRQF